MIYKFNDIELDSIYEKVEELRETVKNNDKYMEYYNKVEELNKGDQLYGWIFNCNAIFNDTPEDLDLYQKAYIREILTIYKNELELIVLKSNL